MGQQRRERLHRLPVEHRHRGTPRGEPSRRVDVDDVPPGAARALRRSRRRSRRRRCAEGIRMRATRSGLQPSTVKPGSSSCMPSTRPSTVRAIGPTVSSVGDSGATPSSDTRPFVVLSPVTPQHAAGMRTEPPVSVAERDVGVVVGDRHRGAARRPARDPAGSSGLTGVPNHGFTPSAPNASSTRLVLPTMRASAARAPARQAASAAAGSAVGREELAARGRGDAGDVDEVLDRQSRPDGPDQPGSMGVMKVAMGAR